MESVLGAVGTLLESLRRSAAEPEVWQALLQLYPLLVDLVPSRLGFSCFERERIKLWSCGIGLRDDGSSSFSPTH